MVQPVDALVEMFADAGATYITFHPDASTHVDRTLNLSVMPAAIGSGFQSGGQSRFSEVRDGQGRQSCSCQ